MRSASREARSTSRRTGDASGGAALRRIVGLLVPLLEAGLLPARDEGERVPAVLRGAARHGRAEHDRLLASGGGAVSPLGRGDARPLPVRGEDAPPEPAGAVHGTGAESRRAARPRADRDPAGSRRRLPRAPARFTGAEAELGARLPARFLGGRGHAGPQSRSTRSRATRSSATCGCASLRTTRPRSPPGRTASVRCSQRASTSTRTSSTRTSRPRRATRCGWSTSCVAARSLRRRLLVSSPAIGRGAPGRRPGRPPVCP